MSPKRAKPAGKARRAQDWILDELRTLGSNRTLSTASVTSKIARASRKRFHKNSVYNALRLLVRQGTIQVARKGRQKLYRLRSGAGLPKGEVPETSWNRPSRAFTSVESHAGTLAHKLSVKDILILNVGESDLVAATNRNGRLALKRHSLP